MSGAGMTGKLARVASVVFIAISPVVLYVAVTRLSVMKAALVIAGWITLRTLPAALATVSRDQLIAAIKLPLVAIAFSVLGALTNNRGLLLLIPSATQLGFAWVFASSLRAGSKMPLVEQFARMQKADLGEDEIKYCRTVTWIWAIYLAACAVAGMVLAWVASPEVWALFTGVGAYVLVAVLFAGEFAFRKLRFRNPEGSAIDRALFRWFPRR
jgi:uncharacterized membrane protein